MNNEVPAYILYSKFSDRGTKKVLQEKNMNQMPFRLKMLVKPGLLDCGILYTIQTNLLRQAMGMVK